MKLFTLADVIEKEFHTTFGFVGSFHGVIDGVDIIVKVCNPFMKLLLLYIMQGSIGVSLGVCDRVLECEMFFKFGDCDVWGQRGHGWKYNYLIVIRVGVCVAVRGLIITIFSSMQNIMAFMFWRQCGNRLFNGPATVKCWGGICTLLAIESGNKWRMWWANSRPKIHYS